MQTNPEMNRSFSHLQIFSISSSSNIFGTYLTKLHLFFSSSSFSSLPHHHSSVATFSLQSFPSLLYFKLRTTVSLFSNNERKFALEPFHLLPNFVWFLPKEQKSKGGTFSYFWTFGLNIETYKLKTNQQNHIVRLFPLFTLWFHSYL